MRDIIYRGKTKYGEWEYGGVVIYEKDAFIITEEDFSWSIMGDRGDYDGCITPVLPETVGQYTGLTDKSGNKIFEADYWLDTDGDYLVYVVEFREGQFGFACYGWKGVLMPYGFDETAGGFGEIDFSPMTDFNIDLIEIDGNIHDNKELLEVK